MRCPNCLSSEVRKLADGLYVCGACGEYVPSGTKASPLSEFARKRVQQAIDYDKSSDTGLKKACVAASFAGVGTYSHVTKIIKDARKRSASTVENWAHAHWMYVEFRKVNRTAARCLWRSLPASHFWLAWDIHYAGYDGMSYLLKAEEHGWSGRDMREEYRKDLEAGQAPMQFARVKLSFRGLADELLAKHGDHLTTRQRAALQEAREAFG